MIPSSFLETTYPQQVVFGAGELVNLRGHLAFLDVERVLVCTSGSYVRNGTVQRVRTALGDRLAGIFDAVRPHVPEATVDAALALANKISADIVVGLGGGSALGTAKAVSLATAETHPVGQQVPICAVPTTYAGSEMTALYGITRGAEGRKVTRTNPKAIPRLVLYDPELTVALPADLTAGTGMNALAHCIEGGYSIGRTPLSTATALAGLANIVQFLPRCIEQPDNLEARTGMLVGAYMGGTTIAHAPIALHHAVCHALGGAAGVPHGVANTIMLPHVMRFNRSHAAAELAVMGRALSLGDSDAPDTVVANSLIETVSELAQSLDMPQRLWETGVVQADFTRLAEVTLKSPALAANPRPVKTPAEIESLLEAAW